jgi:hypothetical protein
MDTELLHGYSGGFKIKGNNVPAIASGNLKRGDILEIGSKPGDLAFSNIPTPAIFTTSSYGKFNNGVTFSLSNGSKIIFWKYMSGTAHYATIFHFTSDGTLVYSDITISTTAKYLWSVRVLSDTSFILLTSDGTGKGLYFYRVDVSNDDTVTVTSLGSTLLPTTYIKNAIMFPLDDTRGVILLGTGAYEYTYSDNCYLYYATYTYDGTTLTISATTQLDYQSGQPYTVLYDYKYVGDTLFIAIFSKLYHVQIDINNNIVVTNDGAVTNVAQCLQLFNNFTDKDNIVLNGSGFYKYSYDISTKKLTTTTLVALGGSSTHNAPNNPMTAIIRPKTSVRQFFGDNTNAVPVGWNKFLIFCNYYIGSGTYPYSPGYCYLDANPDFSIATATTGVLFVNGYIGGNFYAYRDLDKFCFIWNDYQRNGTNTRLPYYIRGTVADGSPASVKIWSGAFSANVAGISQNYASDGQNMNVLIPK